MTDACLFATMDNIRDVSINTIAEPVVSLLRNVEAPLLPKIVLLEPPNAAPISAPLPPCSKTIEIKNRQQVTCRITKSVVIKQNPPCIYIFYKLVLNFTILEKLAAFRLAPPTRAPSTSAHFIRASILSGVTLPP